MTALLAYDAACAFVGDNAGTVLDTAKKTGAIAITGYIIGTPGGCRHVGKSDVTLILQKGMGFIPNWERGASQLITATKAQGVTYGQEAATALVAAGVPAGTAVAFSWDAYTQPSQYANCGQAADGIIAGLAGRYKFNAYAQGGLIQYLKDSHRIPTEIKGWLSMSEGFPGFSVNWNDYVAMVQEHHADGSWYSSPVANTDVNTIIDPHALGAYWPVGSSYGGTMFDDATLKQVAAAVWNYGFTNYAADDRTKTSNVHAAHIWLTHGALGAVNAEKAAEAVQAALPNLIDVPDLAAKIAAGLQGQVSGATPAQVEQIVRDALGNVKLTVGA
jgi:hypothetical protein